MTAIASQGDNVRIVAPKRAYGNHSLKIKPNTARIWHPSISSEVQGKLQEISAVWENQGISDYLIYAYKAANKEEFSGYHVIPYPKDRWWFFQQIEVLWHVTFGPSKVSEKEQTQIAKSFAKDKARFEKEVIEEDAENVQETVSLKDPFCNHDQITKQMIFEGQTINVLLNFAPLVDGKNEFHIMLVPKDHHSSWESLPTEVFEEAEQVTHALVNNFQDAEFYAFVKKGKRAGQTQPHCHKHIVVVGSGSSAICGKLSVLFKMLTFSFKLSDADLKKSVKRVTKMLQPVLEKAD